MATPSPDLPETATELVPRMLKVTAALGLSSVVVIAFTIGRSKLVALQLGPRGIGALALLKPLAALLATLVVIGAFAADVNLVGVVLVAPPVALAVVALASARSLPRPFRRAGAGWRLGDSRQLLGLGIAFV